MGADIHMMAELRQKRQMELYPNGMVNRVYEDGDWKAITQPFFTNQYFDHKEFIKSGETFSAPMTPKPYNGRNYTLFSLLADVRNEPKGTPDYVEPIAMPKGQPPQASSEWYELAGKWDGDGHSHSWFTLAELQAFDWSRPQTFRGYITPDQYPKFKETQDTPSSWFGGTSGKKVTAAEFEEMIEEDKHLVHGILIEWQKPISEMLGRFYTHTLPELEMIREAADVTADNVRICFFFDN